MSNDGYRGEDDDGVLDLDDDFLNNLDDIIGEKDKTLTESKAVTSVDRDNIDDLLGIDNEDLIAVEEDALSKELEKEEVVIPVPVIKPAEVVTAEEVVEPEVMDSEVDVMNSADSLLDEQKQLRKTLKNKSAHFSDRLSSMLNKHLDIVEEVADTIMDGNINPQLLKSYTSMVDSTVTTSKATIELLDKKAEVIADEIYDEGGGATAEGGVSNTLIISSDQLMEVFIGDNQTEAEIEELIAIEEKKEQELKEKKEGEVDG